jgi:hypothetical protein
MSGSGVRVVEVPRARCAREARRYVAARAAAARMRENRIKQRAHLSLHHLRAACAPFETRAHPSPASLEPLRAGEGQAGARRAVDRHHRWLSWQPMSSSLEQDESPKRHYGCGPPSHPTTTPRAHRQLRCLPCHPFPQSVATQVWPWIRAVKVAHSGTHVWLPLNKDEQPAQPSLHCSLPDFGGAQRPDVGLLRNTSTRHCRPKPPADFATKESHVETWSSPSGAGPLRSVTTQREPLWGGEGRQAHGQKFVRGTSTCNGPAQCHPDVHRRRHPPCPSYPLVRSAAANATAWQAKKMQEAIGESTR